MDWRFWKRGEPSPTNETTVNVQRTQLAGYVPLYDVNASEHIRESYEAFAEYGFRGNSVVFALTNRRMTLFSEATLCYRNKRTKKLFTDASLAMFEEPWPNAQQNDLFARMLQDVDLAGNAYIVDRGNRLERLRPDYVSIISEIKPNGAREVVGYAYQPSGDQDREDEYFLVGDVAHWAPIPDPLANFRGMSWLTPVIREIENDTTMGDFQTAYLENAASPQMVIKYANDVDPKRIEALREMIEAKHSGPGNAFKTMIVDGGGDPVVTGSDMQGANFDALQMAGEHRMAAAAGVPALVAGIRQGAINSLPGDYPDQVRQFVDLTLRPLWRSAVSALSVLAEVPGGAELWFDTTDVAALRQGEKDQAETVQVQASAINTFVMAGYEPDSIIAAVVSNDLTLLKHTGLTSVQMLPPSQVTLRESKDLTPKPVQGAAPPAPQQTDPNKPNGGSSGA